MTIAQLRLQGAEALELLRRGRELVATRRRWTTGTYARNKEGAGVAPRKESRPTRFCASGAVLYAEREAHGTWIENRPGLYFETESERIIGPPRMLLALDMLAAGLLGEFALALARTGRLNERRIDYQRLMLTPSATPADVVDRINDNPTITLAVVLTSFDHAIETLEKLIATPTSREQTPAHRTTQPAPDGEGETTP